MSKRIRKIVGVMLVVLASCFCGLTGCKGKYDDMTLELSTKSIELILDEQEDEQGNIKYLGEGEFTASVKGVGSDVSREVFASISSSDVLNVVNLGVDSEGVTKFKLTANSPIKDPVKLTVRTKEGGQTASLDVTATRPLKNISYNNSYSPNAFVVVGQEKIIDSNQAILFEPAETNQKNITYAITQANGHEATIENGKLLVTKKSSTSSTIVVTASSDQAGISSVDIELKVVEPVDVNKISVKTQDGLEITSQYTWSVSNLLTAQTKLKVEVDTLEDIQISASVLFSDQQIFTSSSEVNLSNEITLNTLGYTGTNTLRITVKIKGYEYTTTKDIQIKVEKLPSQILVNNEDISKLAYKEYDIYSNYKNNLGQKFDISVGDQFASDKRFTIFVSEEERKYVKVVYSDGQEIDLSGNAILSSGTSIFVLYVQADDASQDVTPNLVIRTLSGNEFQHIEANLKFALRISAKDIKVKAFGERENIIYVEQNQEVYVSYELSPNGAYANGITCEGYDKSLIDVDIDYSEELPLIKIKAKNVSAGLQTSFRLKLPSGYESETIYVYPYVEALQVNVTAPKITEEYGESIADAKYNAGNVESLVIAKGGYTKLNVVALNANSVATIFGQTFALVDDTDRNFLKINDEGYITARGVKKDDGKINIKAIIKTLSPVVDENGVCLGDASVEEHEIEFSVTVFVQISSISLDKQFSDLYFRNNVWYENGVLSEINKLSVNLSISPSNAVADKIEWQLSNSDNIYVNTSDDGKLCELVAGEIGANQSSDTRNLTLTVFVTQQNKVLSRTVYITLKRVYIPTNVVIDGVKYSSNGKVEFVLNDELNLDVRDLKDSTFIQLVSHVTGTNSAIKPTNSKIGYKVESGNNIIDVDNNGNLIFKKDDYGKYQSGVCEISVYAQGSIYDNYGEPKVKQTFKIVIADGKSVDTAFKVQNKQDFENMLSDAEIDNHYYQITNDIYLGTFTSQSKKAPKYLFGGNNTIYGTFSNAIFAEVGENCQIRNLSINASVENTIDKNFALLTLKNCGYITNVNVNLQKFNLIIADTIDASSDLTIGTLASENSGTIANCSVFGDISIWGNTTINSFAFGGLVGTNKGVISSTNKNFETSSDSITNFSGKVEIGAMALNSAVGAVAGYNFNIIKGLRVDNAQISAIGLDNIGGLVGYSELVQLAVSDEPNASIMDNYVNCIVAGNYNVGGLAGFVLQTKISNNIVEFYETDEIYESSQSIFFAIQGLDDVGGLVGKSQNSAITNNYARNYAEKIYIKGTANIGGLIGSVEGGSISSCFAYVNIKGATNVGGLIGSAFAYDLSVANISNTYSRGKIEKNEEVIEISNAGELIGKWNKSDLVSLVNSYSTVVLTNSSENDDVNNVYFNKTASELETIFTDASVWKVDVSYNDGYPILVWNENIMEKFTISQLNIEVALEYQSKDSKGNDIILIKVNDENVISLNSIFTITNQVSGEVSLNDLILKSSDASVFELNNKNQIVFKSYGKAKLSMAYKYNRSLSKQIDIVFVHDISDFGLKDQNLDTIDNLSVRANSNTLLYAFANDENSSAQNNLFVKVKVEKSKVQVGESDAFKFVGNSFETMKIDETNYYVLYLPLSSNVFNALQKLDAEIKLSLSVVEKIENEYVELTTEKLLTLYIYNGISSISIDKESVNLTTINEIEFTVSVVADIKNYDELELNLVELDNNSHININGGAINNDYDLVLICAENNSTKNADGTFTHAIRYILKMRDEYLLLNNDESGERLELKEGFTTKLEISSSLSDSLSQTIDISVEPQDLLKIDVVHFPNGQETRTSTSDTTLYEPNELPSNTITPGEFGLLMIDIYPEYAYYDEIEVYYETNNNSKMTFVQAAFASIDNNTTQKFVEVKPSALFYNEKIVLSRISQVELEGGLLTKTSFTGRLFVKTLISSSTVAGTKYTIKVKATRYDSDGNIESVLESKPLVIESLPRPSVLLDSDAENIQKDDNGAVVYIARGTSQTVTATTTNYTKYADFSMQFDNLNYEDNAISNSQPQLNQSGNSVTLYVPLSVKAGTAITVTATVSRFINGIEYPSVSSIKFIVVDYVVTGLKTDQINNSMNVPSGQTKYVTLELITKNATKENNSEYIEYENLKQSYVNQLKAYESLIETPDITQQIEDIKNQIQKYTQILESLEILLDGIDSKIKLANTEISTLTNNTWKWTEGDITENLSKKFEATDNNNSSSPFYYISLRQNIDSSMSSKLIIEGKSTRDESLKYIGAELDFKYNQENGQIDFLFNETELDNSKYVSCNLEIYVVTSATIDKPTPISTIEQFLGMSEEDYILMNDLYLTTQDAYFTQPYSQEQVDANSGEYNFYYYDENTRFTSIVPKFKSLDGNGYKIYINSFALAEDVGQNFGFFTEIKENVMVRNLEIVFLNQVISIKNDDLGTYQIINKYNISAESLSGFNFGLFAGENSGIITNCNVSYSNIVASTGANKTALKLDESDSTAFTIELDKNAQAVVGGFVGVNNGYITNSKIGGADNFDEDSVAEQSKVLNIKANGTIGGFVGQNNFRISLCYAYNVGIENTSTNLKDSLTAGFVATNSNNGVIIESFSEGGTVLEENKNEISYEAKSMQNFVSSMGNVGGFVHINNGEIKDSYSNLPIKTPSRSAGFVYMNSGDTAIISECYSRTVSIDQTDTSAFRYFTGTDNKSKVNNLDGATITHCFYMLDQTPTELDKEFKEPAYNVSQSNFVSSNYFYGFDTNIWAFRQTRPTLSRTMQVTKSNRFISGTEVTDGVTTGYSYSYSSDTPLGKAINPIIIYDADSFLRAMNADEFKSYTSDGTNKTYKYNFGSIRLVCDIDFEAKRGSEELKKLQNVVFAGQLNGNGFTLQNIAILGNESTEMFGLFKQVGVEENTGEKTEILNTTINVTEIAKANSKMVGVLAGKIVNSSIVNMNIHGEDVTLEGQNLVGGLAGFIGKGTNLSGITSNVSVTSAYSNYNDNSKYRDDFERVSGANVRYSQSANADYSNLSYAGGIAGIIDLNPSVISITQNNENATISFADNDTNTVDFFSISRLRVQGGVSISGEIVGGIAGHLARGSQIEDAKLVLDSNMHLIGKFASGGLVGENYGVIKTSRVEVADELFEEVDEEFTNNTTLTLFDDENTMPKYVGGLVGVMPVGGIVDSFSKANVVHHNAQYIGGIAGSIGQQVGDEYIKALQEVLKDELKKLSIDKYIMVIGTVVDKAYTTGLVYTNANYSYSYLDDEGKKQNTINSSVLQNGTIESDVTATPQNYVGGLYGKAYVQMFAETPTSTQKEEILNKIFQNIVGINNWRDNISGFGDNIRLTMKGGSIQRTDENGIVITRREGETTVNSKTEFVGNTGYLAGVIEFANADNFIDASSTTPKSRYSYDFYLNNFIGSSQKTSSVQLKEDHIQNQFVKIDGLQGDNDMLKTSLFKFVYTHNSNTIEGVDGDGNSLSNDTKYVEYENIFTNLRYEYRENQAKSEIYYRYFDPTIWDKSTYTYPRLFDNQSEKIVVIKTEDDLFEMANTTGVATTYYLANDIVLTRNWKPIKGFRGKFLSAEGGPYTIYNININTNTESNVAFFATAEDAQIINISFVFGGKLAPERDSSNNYIYLTDEDGKSTGKIKFSGEDFANWNIVNGLYPFTTGGVQENGMQSFANANFDKFTNGGISATYENVNENSTNTGALIASNAGTTVLSVGLQFAKDSHVKVEYKQTNHAKENSFGLISSSVNVDTSKIAILNNISVALDQINPNAELSSVLEIEFDFDSKQEQQTFNYGALFGQVNNSSSQQDRVSIKMINNSLATHATINTITLNNTSDLQNNAEVNVGGMIGYVEKAYISNIYTNLTDGNDIDENKVTLNSGNSEIVNVGGFAGKVNNTSNFIDIQNARKVNMMIVNTLTDTDNTSGLKEKVQLSVGGFVGYSNALSMTDNSETNFVVNSNITLGDASTASSYTANKIMAGGLVGYSQNSNFEKLGINGNITVANTSTDIMSIGGAVGLGTQSKFTNSLSAGNIKVEKENNIKAQHYIGGFAGLIGTGHNSTLVETKQAPKSEMGIVSQNLIAQTNIEVSSEMTIVGNIGGFVGYFNEEKTSLKDSISMGYINCKLADISTNNNALGGFVGYHCNGGINTSISLSTILAKNAINSSSNNIGGFVGNSTSASYNSCYYAYELSGVQDNTPSDKNKSYGNKVYADIVTVKSNTNFAIEENKIVYSIENTNNKDLVREILNASKFSNLLTQSGTKLNPIKVNSKKYAELDRFEDNTSYILTEDISLNGNEYNSKSIGENVTILNPFNPISYVFIGIQVPTGNFVVKISNKATSLFSTIGKNSFVSGVIVDYQNISTIKLQDNGEYQGFAGIALSNNGSIFMSSVKGLVVTNNDLSGANITSIVGNNNGTISGTNSSLEFDFNGVRNTNTNISAFTITNDGYIFYSFANGQIKNVEDVSGKISGFILFNNQTIENCYSAVACVNTNTEAQTSGFVLGNNGDLSECYYDNYAFGNGQSSEVELKLSTNEFMSGNDIELFSNTNIWLYDDSYNYGYPILSKHDNTGNNSERLLQAVKYTGDGTDSEENAYQIHHAGRLDWIRTLNLPKYEDTYFVQTNDIDMSPFGNSGFVTIGGSGYNSAIFNGKVNLNNMIYNGQEHIIDNIKMIEGFNFVISKYINLKTFALFETAKKIENLGVKTTIHIKSVKTGISRVAGIVGAMNYNKDYVLQNCFADVDIKLLQGAQANYIGALAGQIGSEMSGPGPVVDHSFGLGVGSRELHSPVYNSFAIGTIDDTAILNNTYKRAYGGLAGTGGKFNNSGEISSYSAVAMKVSNSSLVDAISNSGDSDAYYDANISLVGNAYMSFIDSWLTNLEENNGKLVPKNSNLGENWTYSKTSYPVQTWVSNNSYAKKILDYDKIGSAISPYQISTYDDLQELGDSDNTYTHFALLSNIAISSSDSDAEIKLNPSIAIKSGATLNGNNKTITINSNTISAFNNASNVTISGLTIDNTYNHIFQKPYKLLTHNYEESTQNAIFTKMLDSSQLFNIVIKTKQPTRIGTIMDLEYYPVASAIVVADCGLAIGTVSSSVIREVSLDVKYENLKFQYNNASLFIGFASQSSIESCDVSSPNSKIIISKTQISYFGALLGYARNSVISKINLSSSLGKLTINSYGEENYIGVLSGYLSNCTLQGITIGTKQQSSQEEFTYSNKAELDVHFKAEVNEGKFEDRVGGLAGSAKKVTASNLTVSNNVYAIAEQELTQIYLGGMFGSIDKSTFDNLKNWTYITRNIGNIKALAKRYKLSEQTYTYEYTYDYSGGKVTVREDNHELITWDYHHASNKMDNSNFGYYPFVGGFAGQIEGTTPSIQAQTIPSGIECNIPLLKQTNYIADKYSKYSSLSDSSITAYDHYTYWRENPDSSFLKVANITNNTIKAGIYSGVYGYDDSDTENVKYYNYCGSVITETFYGLYITYCYGHTFIPYSFEY